MSGETINGQKSPTITEIPAELWCYNCQNFEHFRVYLYGQKDAPVEIFDNTIRFSDEEIEKVECGKCGLECGSDCISYG